MTLPPYLIQPDPDLMGGVGCYPPPDRLGGGGSAPFVRLSFPPWMQKLPESRDFYVSDFSLVLAAGAGSVVAGPSFQIPDSQIGWLQVLGLYVLTPTAATSVTMTVRINGGPVSGFANLMNPPGIANFTVFPAEDQAQVRLPNHCTVDFIITNNNAAGPWTVGGFLGGWYHPEAAEIRAWGVAV